MELCLSVQNSVLSLSTCKLLPVAFSMMFCEFCMHVQKLHPARERFPNDS